MLRRVAFASFAALIVFIASGSKGAKAEVVSLIGAWQTCEPIKGCIRFAFLPNRSVIKQYPMLGTTVTSYGRYHRQGRRLQIVWTRVSPARICGQVTGANKGHHKQCVRPHERNLNGGLQLHGFNALVWKVPGRPPLRLVRVEE